MAKLAVKRLLRFRGYIFAALIFGVALCSFTYELNQKEEAEVYAAYINAHLLRNPLTNVPFSRLVIDDLTSGLPFRDSLKEEIAKLGQKMDAQTGRDFLARNARYFGGFSLRLFRNGIMGRRILNTRIKFQIAHTLISEATMEQIFSNGGWDEFNKRYPNCRGSIDLSNVGFNRNRTQALFYIGSQWDWLAGEGRLILLEKKNGRWTEVDNIVIWVS